MTYLTLKNDSQHIHVIFFLLGSLFHSSLHLSLFLALPPLLCEFVCVYMYYTYVRMGVCIAGCWPMSFWRFYHLCLPSLWKNTGFTNMCWHTQLYVASGASNSGADTHTHSKQFRDRAISYTYTHSIFTYIYTHREKQRHAHRETVWAWHKCLPHFTNKRTKTKRWFSNSHSKRVVEPELKPGTSNLKCVFSTISELLLVLFNITVVSFIILISSNWKHTEHIVLLSSFFI